MRQLFLCLLLSIYGIGAYSQKQDLNLQGAWKLVVAQEINKGIIGNYAGKYATMSETKIWSGNQVMFVSRYKGKKEVSDDYGSGTWKLNGNHYEELYTISSFKELENKTARLRLEMKGDTLVQTFSLNEKFEPVSDTLYIWKYIKIK